MSKRSYAIWWQEGKGSRHAGKLELVGLQMLLSGNGAGRVAVPLEEITAADYVSNELAIRRREGPTIRIGSLDALGALREVSDALAFRPSRPQPTGGL